MSKPKEFYIHPGKGICFEAGERKIKTSGFIRVVEKEQLDRILRMLDASNKQALELLGEHLKFFMKNETSHQEVWANNPKWFRETYLKWKKSEENGK